MDVDVDTLKFCFPPQYKCVKYDECDSFNKLSSAFQMPCECIQCPSQNCQKGRCKDFNNCHRRKKNEGLKGVDILAADGTVLYLIESKDYRSNVKPPVDHIVMEVAKKFRDSLFGVWCGSFCESDNAKQTFFDDIRRKKLAVKFYFHFESPPTPYPSGFFRATGSHGGVKTKTVSLITMLARLKQKMGPMGDCVFVGDMDKMRQDPASFEWKVKEKI